MTYKLPPALEKIVSPVRLVMDDEIREFENGVAACAAVFDHRYVVREIRAAGDEIEVRLKEMEIAPIGEEQSFF